jgi:hypothetical protein
MAWFLNEYAKVFHLKWTRSRLDRGPQGFRHYSQILIISCSLVILHLLYSPFHFTLQNIRDSLISIYFSSGSTARFSGWLNRSYSSVIWFSQIFSISLIWYYIAFRAQGYINMPKVDPLQILPILLQINSGMIIDSIYCCGSFYLFQIKLTILRLKLIYMKYKHSICTFQRSVLPLGKKNHQFCIRKQRLFIVRTIQNTKCSYFSVKPGCTCNNNKQLIHI